MEGDWGGIILSLAFWVITAFWTNTVSHYRSTVLPVRSAVSTAITTTTVFNMVYYMWNSLSGSSLLKRKIAMIAHIRCTGIVIHFLLTRSWMLINGQEQSLAALPPVKTHVIQYTGGLVGPMSILLLLIDCCIVHELNNGMNTTVSDKWIKMGLYTENWWHCVYLSVCLSVCLTSSFVNPKLLPDDLQLCWRSYSFLLTQVLK
jgi:hypothetical protein